MGGLFQLFWGRGRDLQDLGHHSLLGLLTVPWNTRVAPLGVSFHLLIEDQGLVLSAILVPFDLVYVVSSGCDLLSKVVPCPFSSRYGSVLLLVVVSCQVVLTLACQAVLSVHGVSQAGILEWVAISSPK